MNKKTAYIVGAGDFCAAGFHPQPGDLVIAADGGYASLRRAGLSADLLVGDMDSLRDQLQGIARLRFPAKKDETDLALALRLARGRGYTRFALYGALGGRLDHSLANLHLLAGLVTEGQQALIIDPKVVVHAVHNSSLRLPPVKQGRLISVFAWGGPADGVSLRGLAYPLHQVSLDAFSALGVSNQALGLPIRVSVKRGTVLVMIARGDQA